MSDRLAQMRQDEVARLNKELDLAIERIRHYRATYPAINELDSGYYVDGSNRHGLEDSGGFAGPTYRMWDISSIFGRELVIFENIEWDRWSMWESNSDIGNDIYGLALSDPNHATYHNSTLWVGRVDLEQLAADASMTLDTIVWMTDSLTRFFSDEAAFRDTVDSFLAQFNHSAKGQLVFS